jgi:hypothetical protein
VNVDAGLQMGTFSAMPASEHWVTTWMAPGAAGGAASTILLVQSTTSMGV